eukprot:6195062-Pleurochrysis_carterae.AAC.1
MCSTQRFPSGELVRTTRFRFAQFVRCAEWHPSKALIATGSKDQTLKLWDPKAPKEVTSRTARARFTL